MPVEKLNSVNQKVVNSTTPKRETATNTANNEPKKIDKKKLAVGIGAAAGVAALAIGGILYARNGKANPKLQEGIKNFIDSNGNKIEGIKLEKGKAIASDGSMFSGIMETITKSGKKVSLEYQDGFMIQSKINGKLFNKFENINIPAQDGKIIQTLSRNQGTRIIRYDNDGNFNGMFEHLYHDNGKIKRAVSETKAIDFFENGKIQAKESRYIKQKPSSSFVPKTLDEYTNSYTINSIIYNKEGQIESIAKVDPFGPFIEKTNPDGSTVKKYYIHDFKEDRFSSLSMISERKHPIYDAYFNDKNENTLKAIYSGKMLPYNGRDRISIWDRANGQTMECSFARVSDKYSGSDFATDLEFSGELNNYQDIFKLNKSGFEVHSKSQTEKVYTPEEKEKLLKQLIQYIKKEISVAEESDIVNADKISKQLPGFLKKFE